MHVHLHTYTEIYIHSIIHAYMHEFIHKNKLPHYPIDHRQWENDIHSFIPDIFIAPV